jgi:hypothetical protein
MDKKYLQLFSELAHAVEVLSEQVMEYDRKKNDTKGEQTAQSMRDDYANLYDKLRNNAEAQITKSDYAKLLVAAYIVVNNIEDRIKGERKAIEGYKIDIIPKLSRINDETTNDAEASALAEEIFKIQQD